MGIIKQGILGGFSKKVGSVVGTSWKGIAVMKSMPQSVVNPKTTLQVNQRNAFRETSKLASLLLSPCIQECWNRWAKRESGYNAFVKANIENIKTGNVSFGAYSPHLTISNGELMLAGLAGTSVDGEDSITFNATWTGATLAGRYDKATDIVKMFVLIVKAVDGVVDWSMSRVKYATPVARSVGAISITVDDLGEDEYVMPYMYAVSADGYFRSENLDYYSKLS